MYKRAHIESALSRVKSKSKKTKGLFEDQYKEELKNAIEEEAKAQKQVDEVIYDILNLSQYERAQIENSLKELNQLRRLRTKTSSLII